MGRFRFTPGCCCSGGCRVAVEPAPIGLKFAMDGVADGDEIANEVNGKGMEELNATYAFRDVWADFQTDNGPDLCVSSGRQTLDAWPKGFETNDCGNKSDIYTYIVASKDNKINGAWLNYTDVPPPGKMSWSWWTSRPPVTNPSNCPKGCSATFPGMNPGETPKWTWTDISDEANYAYGYQFTIPCTGVDLPNEPYLYFAGDDYPPNGQAWWEVDYEIGHDRKKRERWIKFEIYVTHDCENPGFDKSYGPATWEYREKEKDEPFTLLELTDQVLSSQGGLSHNSSWPGDWSDVEIKVTGYDPDAA